MTRALLASLVLCTGCHSLLGIDDFHTVDAGTASDDGPSEIDASLVDAQLCYGTLTRVCLPSAPTSTVIIAGTLDTSSDPRCTVIEDDDAGFLCVIAGGNISVEATDVTGTRPLVLVAAGSITLEDVLDAGSRRAPRKLGPAARSVACSGTQMGAGGTSGGGGAGGSFGSLGGGGGNGLPAASGGTPNAVASVTMIRSGCGGGQGGSGAAGSGGPGPSGGAVALYAGSQIAIPQAGAIYASGAGGGGAGSGGGGGSGGLIVLEAPAIQILGKVVANGGAGGGGGATTQGEPGADGTKAMHATAALGGNAESATNGGKGGNGAALQMAATSGSTPTAAGGGGGGGGGSGVIWIKGVLSGNGAVSPAPEMH